MSNFAFGTYRISEHNPQHIEALRYAIESGITMIDTSTNYMDGGAERAIALAFREFDDDKRDDVEIVSKFGYIQNFNVTWDGGSNAGYYDLFLTIHLEEKNTTISDEWQNKDLEWKAGEGILSQGHKIVGKNFYIYLQNNLKEDPNIKRKFIGFDIKVRGVGKEFKEYTDILKTNLGITSSQQIPTYTNMSNGYGVFSSISTNDLNGFYLHEQTLDSLKIGIYTKKLNFE